jgi:inhibitor of cysteine peptidase
MTARVLEIFSVKNLVLVLCIFLTIIGSGSVSIGCINSAELKEPEMSEIAIVQSDRGKTFELSQDDIISIRLDENPSTGYQWEVEAFDARIVELQNSDYTRATGTGVGAGGIRTFTFQARSPGTMEIRLKLRREWESESASIDRFQVTLRVEKK